MPLEVSNASRLYNMMQGRGERALIILDTRPASEFVVARVRNAVHVPVADLLHKPTPTTSEEEEGNNNNEKNKGEPEGLTIQAIERFFTSGVAISKFRNRQEANIFIYGSYPEEAAGVQQKTDSRALAEFLAENPPCPVFLLEEGFGFFFGRYPFMCTGDIDSEMSEEEKQFDGKYFPAEVIPGFLYLGDQRNSENKHQLSTLNIRRIVNAAAEMGNPFDGDFDYSNIAIHDTLGQDLFSVLEMGCDIIDQARNAGHRVFVHCAFGQSRSASVVLAYLMRARNLTLEEALIHLVKCKEDVKPNPNFLQQLGKWEKHLASTRKERGRTGGQGGGFMQRVRRSVAAIENAVGGDNDDENFDISTLTAAPGAVVDAVSVTGTCLTEDSEGQVYVRYNVEVKKKESSWLVSRRYQQFKELHSELQMEASSSLPPFPGTSWRRQLKNQEYLDKKCEKLNIYMVRVLAHPKAAASPALSKFLDVLDEGSGGGRVGSSRSTSPVFRGENKNGTSSPIPEVRKSLKIADKDLFPPHVEHLQSLLSSDSSSSSSSSPLEGADLSSELNRLKEENDRLRRVLKSGMHFLLQGATSSSMGDEIRLEEFLAICLRTMDQEAKSD